MKRTFPLHIPGQHDDRVRDKIRREINKHVRRELQKVLPRGFGSWGFSCKVGPIADTAEARTLKEVAAAIDAVALTGATGVYVEIVTAPVARKTLAVAPTDAIMPEPPAAPSVEV